MSEEEQKKRFWASFKKAYIESGKQKADMEDAEFYRKRARDFLKLIPKSDEPIVPIVIPLKYGNGDK